MPANGSSNGGILTSTNWPTSTEAGYLVVFDRTPDTSWEKKLFIRQEQYGKYRIGVWGM